MFLKKHVVFWNNNETYEYFDKNTQWIILILEKNSSKSWIEI